MKKAIQCSILFAAIFLFLRLDVAAQISVGLRGGVNFSNLRVPTPIEYKSKAGVNAALLFNMPVNRYFSLQVEPGFSQRGAKFDFDAVWLAGPAGQRTRSFGEISLGYVEVPVLFQYKPRIGKFEGIVSLGPEFRFRLGPQKIKSTTQKYQNGVLLEDSYTEYDLTQPNGYRAFDFGLTGGAGVAYPLQFGKIFTEARYHYGLRKMSDADLYNKGVSVHLGVLIPLKK